MSILSILKPRRDSAMLQIPASALEQNRLHELMAIVYEDSCDPSPGKIQFSATRPPPARRIFTGTVPPGALSSTMAFGFLMEQLEPVRPAAATPPVTQKMPEPEPLPVPLFILERPVLPACPQTAAFLVDAVNMRIRGYMRELPEYVTTTEATVQHWAVSGFAAAIATIPSQERRGAATDAWILQERRLMGGAAGGNVHLAACRQLVEQLAQLQGPSRGVLDRLVNILSPAREFLLQCAGVYFS